ncbi:GspMb/PilO family protein [Roseimicrobium sp. ORNL1]|uniref:GspMb/PilO family protein n=1 Tax=Roseimicrobium sp. ORNL1 TaxID=2711231 RepID=UPI0013E12835|nr:GspMb/PilO family protein [Roseimicrobium sp. ORNL1]QIF05915.1 hypothetical protein G5S37_31990 [Roseimicrobium sp. ORNL1]
MKENERRLLMVFVVLAAVMGGAILSQRFLQWSHRLDRLERDLELAKMESDVLIAQASLWKQRSEWILQTQPVAADSYDAGKGLLVLKEAAEQGGIEVLKTQIEPEAQTAYYQQYGVTLTVRGELPKILGWIYSTLDPSAFIVVPRLRISPEKDDKSQNVVATVTFQRRFNPQFAGTGAAPASVLTPSEAAASVPVPVNAPVLSPEVGNP